MVSGLFCVMFSIIAAIGVSQLQFIDLNSPRNIFIMGFGLYMSLSIQVSLAKRTYRAGSTPLMYDWAKHCFLQCIRRTCYFK